MSEDNTYSTTDFYTTAVLVFKKFEVIRISTDKEKGKGRVKRFHFENTPELQETVMSYMNGKLEGNLRGFRNSIETVKDMVHSG